VTVLYPQISTDSAIVLSKVLGDADRDTDDYYNGMKLTITGGETPTPDFKLQSLS